MKEKEKICKGCDYLDLDIKECLYWAEKKKTTDDACGEYVKGAGDEEQE
jgi:hypothetical protein